MISKWAHSAAFTVSIVLLGLGVFYSPLGYVLEREFGLKSLFSLRGPVASPETVAVVGINSSSGPDMGLSRLPRHWPRSLHGVVVERLQVSGVPSIVFDMDFSEPKVPIDDQLFADAIAAHGSVVLFERLDGRSQRIVGAGGSERWVWVETAEQPAEPLRDAARAVAPFPLPKTDNAAYQFWAFKPSRDDAPTTAVVAVQLALLPHHQAWRHVVERAGVAPSEVPPASALAVPGALHAYMVRLRKLFLGQPFLRERVLEMLGTATDLTAEERRSVHILAALYGGPDERYTNFYGPPGTIRTAPYQALDAQRDVGLVALGDAITPTDATRELAGRTVFVGYSDLYSPDQPDRFYTVFTDQRGIDLSGCEIMATAFANLLDDTTIRPLDTPLALAAIAGFGAVIALLVFWLSAYVAVPIVLLLAVGYVVAALQLFSTHQLWVPLATPIGVQLPLAVFFGLLGHYLLERRQKQRVGRAIAHYLPQHLVKELTEGRVDAGSLNQVVHGVCLANDMAGFSAIAEKKSPGELAQFMNAYFETVAAALKRCGVDVTEFHADTIMCAFIGQPDDPEVRRRAVRAALSVVQAIETFSAGMEDVHLTPRVGLQDGPFYLGHTGGGGRLSYSILGNPANGAARLEGLNKPLGTRVLAADSVVRDLDDFVLRPLGEFKVVGKDDVVQVVEVLAPAEAAATAPAPLLQEFASALATFRAERWEQARQAFEGLATRFRQDGPSAFYRAVCQRYVTDGPPDLHPTRLAMTSK